MKLAKYLGIVLGNLLMATAYAGTGIEAHDSKQLAETEKARSLMEQDYLTGDWGGTRTQLQDKGVTLGATYIGETMGNVSGGAERTTVYAGRLQLSLSVDFEKLADFKGGSFYASAYEIHGRDLSAGSIHNLMTVSNIEAYDTFRLFDLWYQQELFDGKLAIRFGQLAADDEFLISQYGSLFLNGTFGWPTLVSANLPNGGPGYPLAAPAVLVRLAPIEQLTLTAAVFDSDAGDNSDEGQKFNSSGTRVDLNQGALGIFEAAYKLNQEKDAKGLPGTYKVGGYFNTYHTADVAAVDADDNAIQHSDNWGVYFIADQMVWREPGATPKKVDPQVRCADSSACDEPSNQGLGVFWRIGGTPSNRNTVDFYTDGGLNYTGLIPGRDADVAGFSVAYAQISDDLVNAARAANNPVPSYEMVFEWTYQIVMAPWWTIQPDIQYIIHPGAGSEVDDGGNTLKNAVVLGLRTSVTF
jgi:porin